MLTANGIYFYINYGNETSINVGRLKEVEWLCDSSKDDFEYRMEYVLSLFKYSIIAEQTMNEILSKLDTIQQEYIDKRLAKEIDRSVVYIKPIIQLKKEYINDGLTHNERIYGNILNDFKINDKHDRKFIANKLSNLYKKYACIDNCRICKSDKDKTMTELYEYLYNKGHCGFYDDLIYNEVTDTYFMIGFNYGH